jgi:hypothetical protein
MQFAAKWNALCGKTGCVLPQNTGAFCRKLQGCFAAKHIIMEWLQGRSPMLINVEQ